MVVDLFPIGLLVWVLLRMLLFTRRFPLSFSFFCCLYSLFFFVLSFPTNSLTFFLFTRWFYAFFSFFSFFLSLTFPFSLYFSPFPSISFFRYTFHLSCFYATVNHPHSLLSYVFFRVFFLRASELSLSQSFLPVLFSFSVFPPRAVSLCRLLDCLFMPLIMLSIMRFSYFFSTTSFLSSFRFHALFLLTSSLLPFFPTPFLPTSSLLPFSYPFYGFLDFYTLFV